MQLARQIGEHLVAAKLGRMGYLATPFAGNIPLFDLLVADQRGSVLPIQVKTIRGPSWQFRADAFLDVEVVDGEQRVRGTRVLSNPSLLCIFVVLRADENDEFYIFQLNDLQEHLARSYKGGRRPKSPDSMHCAIWPSDLRPFRDNWALLQAQFVA